MNKILLVSLCLFANSAFATWTFLDKNDVANVYYEYESVKKEGNSYTAFIYIEFNKQQNLTKSGLYQIKFECGSNQYIGLRASEYGESGLKNLINEDLKETQPETMTPFIVKLSKFLCHL